jgi:hypothetical protein
MKVDGDFTRMSDEKVDGSVHDTYHELCPQGLDLIEIELCLK